MEDKGKRLQLEKLQPFSLFHLLVDQLFPILFLAASIVECVAASATEDQQKDDPKTAVVSTSAESAKSTAAASAAASQQKNDPKTVVSSVRSCFASTSTVCCS